VWDSFVLISSRMPLSGVTRVYPIFKDETGDFVKLKAICYMDTKSERSTNICPELRRK
jgi:hypothetical protein